MRTSILAFLFPAILFGCSASTDTSFFGSGGASASSAGHGGAAATTSGDTGIFTGSVGTGSGPGPGSGGGGPENAEVFSHSPDTLFRLDPLTKQVTIVGPFMGYDMTGMI